MTKLDDHPSVVRFRRAEPRPHPDTLDADRLRRLCLDAGADDVGFVAIDRPELDDQRAEILGLYPWARGLIGVVCRSFSSAFDNCSRMTGARPSVGSSKISSLGEWTNARASVKRRFMPPESFI